MKNLQVGFRGLNWWEWLWALDRGILMDIR